MNSTPSSLAGEILQKFLHLDSPAPGVVYATRQISEAFTARGNAFLAGGQYHLAVRDFGAALNHRFEESAGDDYNPEAADNRRLALLNLGWFFRSNANPAHPDSEMPAWARDAVRNAKIPHSYLIVANNESILTFCPPTDEGRDEAIAFADEVAADPHLRSKIDNLYLSETDDFDTTVYRYDGTNLEEVHRAAARDEHGTLVRE